MLFWQKKKEISRVTQLEIGDIIIDVIYKNIRNIHLKILSPGGKVLITSPNRITKATLREFAVSKIDWIKKHQQKIRLLPKPTSLNYERGEFHFFFGKKYLLNIIFASAKLKVILNQQSIDMYVRPGTNKSQRKKLMDEWYREKLRESIPDYISRWEKIMNVEVIEFGIKKMKTRWGTCNTRAKRIWINLELAKKPNNCLEYIVVHEMVHLLERSHNQRFKMLMNTFLPDWKTRQEELNSFPTKHVQWEY